MNGKSICLLAALLLLLPQVCALGPMDGVGDIRYISPNQGKLGFYSSGDVWWIAAWDFLYVYGPRQPVLIARHFDFVNIQVPNVDWAGHTWSAGRDAYNYGDTTVVVNDGLSDGNAVTSILGSQGIKPGSIETYEQTVNGLPVIWGRATTPSGTKVWALTVNDAKHNTGHSVNIISSNGYFEQFIMPTIRAAY